MIRTRGVIEKVEDDGEDARRCRVDIVVESQGKSARRPCDKDATWFGIAEATRAYLPTCDYHRAEFLKDYPLEMVKWVRADLFLADPSHWFREQAKEQAHKTGKESS